ncbi:hypothetical protein, partial [Salmonella sp. SAL4458]|uniref:hypothetical protein n=1 Tax=Salmonella sp. SAL4458 TaxID=3159913 RepID=UPI00397E6574
GGLPRAIAAGAAATGNVSLASTVRPKNEKSAFLYFYTGSLSSVFCRRVLTLCLHGSPSIVT